MASVEDVDTAVPSGPGLRWAAMGPTLPFHLGAGEGGPGEFWARRADTSTRWWDDPGPLVTALVAATREVCRAG
ncbi:hypothetical protein [Geodermatophilus sp. URMC 62]|uniref:hypothetical protein n=1 Tax=Geodermatophilus sp. URMC 62 TaxID=3423414 RepID=UPI00406CDEB8